MYTATHIQKPAEIIHSQFCFHFCQSTNYKEYSQV